jgi:hypothetical protein
LNPDEVLSFNEPPREFRVGQPFPNPFNSAFDIAVEIPYIGSVAFGLYDVQGRRLAHNRVQLTAGTHRRRISEFLDFDTGRLQSGLYLLRVEFGAKRINRKLVLVK